MSQTTAVAQPVTPADRAAVAQTLTLAFHDDPVMSWMAGPRHARFRELAPRFFAGQVSQTMRVGGAWTVTGDRAAALWRPPGTSVTDPLSVVEMFPAALRLFGGRLGVALSALNAMDRMHPTEPHWYLAVLGTHPDHQGKGYGAVVIKPVLDRCDRDGTPAYLESSNERNLTFYERQGFKVLEKVGLPRGGPPVWRMWREPA